MYGAGTGKALERLNEGIVQRIPWGYWSGGGRRPDLLVNNDSVGGFKMEQIMNYVKPELIVVAIALYFLGLWLKQAAFVKDKFIPLVLGIVGIFVCGIWVMATATFSTGQDIALALFTAIVQGILVAGLSTYVNQFIKQLGKDE